MNAHDDCDCMRDAPTKRDIEQRDGCLRIENEFSALKISKSGDRIEFSFSDIDGNHACYSVDAADAARALAKIIGIDAAERERCARICDEIAEKASEEYEHKCLRAPIKHMYERTNGEAIGASTCARWIRGEGC